MNSTDYERAIMADIRNNPHIEVGMIVEVLNIDDEVAGIGRCVGVKFLGDDTMVVEIEAHRTFRDDVKIMRINGDYCRRAAYSTESMREWLKKRVV